MLVSHAVRFGLLRIEISTFHPVFLSHKVSHFNLITIPASLLSTLISILANSILVLSIVDVDQLGRFRGALLCDWGCVAGGL